MAEKTILHASFWYTNKNGVGQTALRGDKVNIPNEDDVERGERLGAFATDEDMRPGTPLGDLLAAREATAPTASVFLDLAEVEGRQSLAGSSDPRVQFGLIDPATVRAPVGAGDTTPTPIATIPPPISPAPEIDPPVKPGRTESRDKWAAYATAMGAKEAETAPVDQGGLSRDELRTKYGS